MQVDSPSSLAPAKCLSDDRFLEDSGKLSEDLGLKLKISGSEEEEERRNLERSDEDDCEAISEEDEEEEEEFSFASVETDGSPITAEEAFQNGLIRPVYPLFDRNLLIGFEEDHDGDGVALRPPLKKLFVDDRDGGDNDSASESVDSSDPQGPFCSWTGKTVAEASPESCRKSNSTGFSKLWRFRDLLLRSNSDGKDAFVFIGNIASSSSSSKQSREKTPKKGSSGTGKKKGTSSAHEKLYVRNRATREEARRRSYLPYKQVGFFTDVNGLSRNIHPF